MFMARSPKVVETFPSKVLMSISWWHCRKGQEVTCDIYIHVTYINIVVICLTGDFSATKLGWRKKKHCGLGSNIEPR